ncbi:MAG: amidohydrolase family protein [Proteobacteria bacterium]|nr:amidohydrolase family protein [Pseudomonadota bacterium]
MAAPIADILIHGGTLVDGSADPPRNADVVIAGDRILYVGPDAASRYRSRRTVDAAGRIVAPGFIDPHSHPDEFLDPARGDRLVLPWLMQGVTTLVVGVDGGGTPGFGNDVRGFLSEISRRPTGPNVATYVGFGAVRHAVLGDASRGPSAAELERMRALVARGMCDGALGLSTGLFYPPQSFATTEEVIALAREAGTRGGRYDSHLRDESSYSVGLVAAVQEALRIGREAGLPVHIAHIKALGVDVQGLAPRLVDLIDSARRDGLDVTADQYPWDASGTSLEAALVPRWAFDGGRLRMLQRLDAPESRESLRKAMSENLRRRGGAESLLLIAPGEQWSGQRLAVVAARWSIDPVDAAARIMRSRSSDTDAISFNMADDDIDAFMRQPWVVTSTDGSQGHPRMYATFPRKYSRYVLERHVLTLAEFVNRSTGRTAEALGLTHRGFLRAGDYADVVVFDPDRFRPAADYLHPRRLSQGVATLIVNGQIAIDQGRVTRLRAGRPLRGPAGPAGCGGGSIVKG